MDPEEIGWKDVDWIHLAQDTAQCPTLVDMVLCLKFHTDRGIPW
jgi:hypothetical protein